MREELFRADGRMDRQTKRQADRHDGHTVRFLKFANAHENVGVTQNVWVNMVGIVLWFTPVIIVLFAYSFIYIFI
jgi:hypothetical protein